jgi:manganese/zinc/iron transport system permease protein
LLRAIYELLEARSPDVVPAAQANGESPAVLVTELVSMRSWTARGLASYMRRAQSQGLVTRDPPQEVRLTRQGLQEAEKLTYDHRLWELFLTHYADVAPAQVDRAADAIEHVLDADMIAELESLLPQRRDGETVPPSLHATRAMQLGEGAK